MQSTVAQGVAYTTQDDRLHTAHPSERSHAGAEASVLPGFIWGSGVECSTLPHLDVDQFKWTQHDRFWREDLKRAVEELGIRHLRYTFPWHFLEPARGNYQWAYADERMAEFERLGIEPILDVAHFGTPVWLKQAVGDPEFPEALEEFAEQLVNRYRGSVKMCSPFNEPLVSALFSGDFGFWPPHARGWRGYMPVLSRIMQATSRAIRAIRRSMPEATVVLCDVAENYKTRSEELQAEVARRNLRRFVGMDLLSGRVDANHPLHAWLSGYGISELDLEWFRTHPQMPDILGLDYYPHGDWQLEMEAGVVRQRRADKPLGLHGLASTYYNRYGIPMMVTETSVEGKAINREIWLDTLLDDTRRLRQQGVPMVGFIWWPLLDQLDWDGALTHRIGKIHEVGIFKLRVKDGVLQRTATPLLKQFRAAMAAGNERVGELAAIATPARMEEPQLPPLGQWQTPTQFEIRPLNEAVSVVPASASTPRRAVSNGSAKGNGATDGAEDAATGAALAPKTARSMASEDGDGVADGAAVGVTATVDRTARLGLARDAATGGAQRADTGGYGIVVFSHLRWGFVWQRPQQFLSRFARKHPVLFVEEPFFDRAEGTEPDVQFHRVMPNVTVACPHFPPSWNGNPDLPEMLRRFTHQAIERMNEDGEFDRPLLWYYSPMDSTWSLGHFENRGIVYDAMDELSQFTGAPKALIDNERRLMASADIVFTGGYELSLKKKQHHSNVHFFGCGVEYEHFAQAMDAGTPIPPDIDFVARPIIGWFGVIDERVNYGMVGDMARMRPNWSFAMVGPVVKVDPNLLPNFPNLHWLGQRDYAVLPNYCRAFDICMMPFALNAATEYINPTKALEYLATGRPVISTPVKDVVRQYEGLVEVVKSAEEFVTAIDRDLRQPPAERIARGLERARESSWERTVQSMQGLIEQAVGQEGRPSARKIAPLPPSRMAFAYQATQGS